MRSRAYMTTNGGTTADASRRIPSNFGCRLFAEPARWLDVEVDADLLHLGVGIVSVRPELAADAGLLVAAPRRFVVRRVIRIDPRDSGPHLPDHPMRFGDVLRKDCA